MRKLLSVVFTFGFLTIVSGQVIENRMSLRIGLHQGTYSGDSVTNEHGFITPSLFPHLKGPTGISVDAIYKLHPLLNLGVGAELLYAYGWVLQTSDAFDGANVLASSLYPFIQIHTPFTTTGFFNKLELMGGIGFFSGKVHFKMENYKVEIQGNTRPKFISVSETNTWQGLRIDFGLNYYVNDKIGFTLYYWNKNGKVDASFYSDKQVSASGVGIGLVYNVLKKKRIGY